jgi:hypothetical protein
MKLIISVIIGIACGMALMYGYLHPKYTNVSSENKACYKLGLGLVNQVEINNELIQHMRGE